MVKRSEDDALSDVADRLITSFSDIPDDRVRGAVEQAAALFQHSRIRDFVPLLVERKVRIELAGHRSHQTVTAGL